MRSIGSSEVKLPNGDILNTSNTVSLPVLYLPTKHKESIKFYIVDIKQPFILGADWIRGNRAVLNLENATLRHSGFNPPVVLPIHSSASCKSAAFKSLDLNSVLYAADIFKIN